jgi:DNA-binding NarL/FixJ family response regulator
MNRSTVLIADDSSEWCSLIAQVLEGQYEIIGFVARGDEILRRAMKLHPDIVILDVSLPGMSGLQVLPMLRSALPDAAIVIVTTTVNKLYVDEAYRRGASGYIDKRRVRSDLVPTLENASP